MLSDEDFERIREFERQLNSSKNLNVCKNKNVTGMLSKEDCETILNSLKDLSDIELEKISKTFESASDAIG
jgi:hypothetical protein